MSRINSPRTKLALQFSREDLLVKGSCSQSEDYSLVGCFSMLSAQHQMYRSWRGCLVSAREDLVIYTKRQIPIDKGGRSWIQGLIKGRIQMDTNIQACLLAKFKRKVQGHRFFFTVSMTSTEVLNLIPSCF